MAEYEYELGVFDLNTKAHYVSINPKTKSSYKVNSSIYYQNGTVMEMGYDADLSTFVQSRIRPDKFGKPNARTTFNDVFDDIKNPINFERLLYLCDIKQMRAYHGLQKQMIIDKYINHTGNKKDVLDIGIGRFGDADKYKNINMLVGIEPNELNIKDFRKRKVRINYPFTIIHGKGENIDQLVLPVKKFDVVCMFFVLTFFFKSEELLDELLRNISKILKDDGKFIGCVSLTKNLIGKENEYYSVELLNDSDTAYGKEILMNINDKGLIVDNERSKKNNELEDDEDRESKDKDLKDDDQDDGKGQIEYIVNFDILVNKCKNYGLILEYHERFLPITDMNEDLNDFITGNMKFSFVKGDEPRGDEIRGDEQQKDETQRDETRESDQKNKIRGNEIRGNEIRGNEIQLDDIQKKINDNLHKERFHRDDRKKYIKYVEHYEENDRRNNEDEVSDFPLKEDEILKEDRTIYFHNKYNQPLIRMGVMKEGSCFIDSILRSIDDVYVDIQDRETYVENKRKDISHKLSFDEWKTLPISEIVINDKKEAYEKLKRNLGRYSTWIDDTTRQIVIDYFKVNVVLVGNNGIHYKDVSIYNPDFPCIIMYYIKNTHFEPVYRICKTLRKDKIKYYMEKTFLFEDPLIQEILKS